MSEAVREFAAKERKDCFVYPAVNKSQYVLVRMNGWPYPIHYEFRDHQTDGLFVELHLEHRRYWSSGEVIEEFGGYTLLPLGKKIIYMERRPAPHRKDSPSLSIEMGLHPCGKEAAEVMSELIDLTCDTVARRLVTPH
jgi:hypothetical protein